MFLPPDVLEWPLNVAVVRSGGRTILIDAGLGVEFPDFPTAGRLALRLEAAGIDPASVTDVVLTHMHMDHIGGLLGDGLREPAASGPAGPRGRRRGRVLGGARFLPHHHAGRGCRTRFGRPPRGSWTSTAASCGRSRRSTRWRREWSSSHRRHTPGHSVVRLASGGDRLTFAGDAVFQVAFEHPEWFNGFEHDPEEAARVRVRLLRELASTGEALVATHLPFPSVCHVAVAGNAFRWRTGRLGLLTACWLGPNKTTACG